MGKQQRAVYVCDKCGTETLEPRDVRKIVGNISDGESQHNYVGNNFIKGKQGALSTNVEIDRTIGDTQICSNMYCLKCLPDVLKLGETTTERKAVDLLKDRIETESTENLIKNAKKSILDEKKRQSILPEEDSSERLDNIIESFEDNIEENNIEGNKSQANLQALKNGDYHILARIKDEEGEELVAKFYHFESVRDMRQAYGGPLIGIFAATGKYVNDISNDCKHTSVEVIVGTLMGIPNVNNIECYANENFAFAETSVMNELMSISKEV